MFDLNQFISIYVTKRSQSMFLKDIEDNKEELSKKLRARQYLLLEELVPSVHLLSGQFFRSGQRLWLL